MAGVGVVESGEQRNPCRGEILMIQRPPLLEIDELDAGAVAAREAAAAGDRPDEAGVDAVRRRAEVSLLRRAWIVGRIDERRRSRSALHVRRLDVRCVAEG